MNAKRMEFLKLWMTGYQKPAAFAEGLQKYPAPQWGFSALLIRSLLVSLLLYLPLACLGRVPPTPSFLSFLSSETYYATLIFLTPLVFFLEWLLGGSVIHLLLRFHNLPSDIDQILNLTGMAGLVVAAVLLLWDWVWLGLDVGNQYLLGISHLLIDSWYLVLLIVGLKKLFNLPFLLAFYLSMVSFLFTFPLAVLLMRAPY